MEHVDQMTSSENFERTISNFDNNFSQLLVSLLDKIMDFSITKCENKLMNILYRWDTRLNKYWLCQIKGILVCYEEWFKLARHISIHPSIHPSISILDYRAVRVPFYGAGSTRLCWTLALHASLSSGSTSARPHLLKSVLTHSQVLRYNRIWKFNFVSPQNNSMRKRSEQDNDDKPLVISLTQL